MSLDAVVTQLDTPQRPTHTSVTGSEWSFHTWRGFTPVADPWSSSDSTLTYSKRTGQWGSAIGTFVLARWTLETSQEYTCHDPRSILKKNEQPKLIEDTTLRW